MLMEADDRTRSRLAVILDIRMPQVDGTEVLRRIRSNDKIATIPVYVFTTGDDRHEAERCHQLGCTAYITKAVEYRDFIQSVRQLAHELQNASFSEAPSERT
jgi:CheY-like chemotaxis protein